MTISSYRNKIRTLCPFFLFLTKEYRDEFLPVSLYQFHPRPQNDECLLRCRTLYRKMAENACQDEDSYLHKQRCYSSGGPDQRCRMETSRTIGTLPETRYKWQHP